MYIVLDLLTKKLEEHNIDAVEEDSSIQEVSTSTNTSTNVSALSTSQSSDLLKSGLFN